jgi:hypothetical protein
MLDHHPFDRGGGHYQIVVRGELEPAWAEWFGDFDISCPTPGTSLLDGQVVDQAALYGLLGRLHDLNLPLLAVHRLDHAPIERSIT